MEANVDIQKLQILNDRITQALEALDQVRLSVHGISHTPALDPWTAQQAQVRPPYASPVPYGVAFIAPQSQVPSMQHTAPQQGFVPAYGAMQTTGFVQPLQPGLTHTSPELIQQKMLEARFASDPVRLAQTFPNLNIQRVVQGSIF
jgi:hypothetical protein